MVLLLIFLLLPPAIVTYSHARGGWSLVLMMWPLFVIVGAMLMLLHLMIHDVALQRIIESTLNAACGRNQLGIVVGGDDRV